MDRHRFRACWHDYNGGIYFVTICTHQKRHLFGEIVGTRFIASELGKITEKHIINIPSHYDNVEVWNHIVMPNHVHVIIYVGTRFIGSENKMLSKKLGCLKPPRHDLPMPDFHHNSRLAVVIGAFKAGVTREYRLKISRNECRRDESRIYDAGGRDESRIYGTGGRDESRIYGTGGRDESRPYKVWQSRFHEHIIRSQYAYDNIDNYITNNPLNWQKDCFYA